MVNMFYTARLKYGYYVKPNLKLPEKLINTLMLLL